MRMLKRFEASALTSSKNARPIIQLSTTTIATVSTVSDNTRARAFTEVFTFARDRLSIPPLTSTGNVCGVISTTEQPARSSAFNSTWAAPIMHTTARIQICLIMLCVEIQGSISLNYRQLN